jgi:hypothetical protein
LLLLEPGCAGCWWTVVSSVTAFRRDVAAGTTRFKVEKRGGISYYPVMSCGSKLALLTLLAIPLIALPCGAAVYNLKVVTDASPDYSDMESMVRSITTNWKTPEEKCWAVFYWNHIARRQTAPMVLHGLALTDPIRQFNDYGYTMCSTISGINCSIWDAMGLKAKYWDISNHTVPEVEYDGRWHMYDNSMSALYTLCDGHTLAGVGDIGKPGACAASGGKTEPGHIAKYHCLMSTSPHGFLTGADTIRSLDEEYHCFNPNGLKYRSYFYDWDRGHRYILNLRQNEQYTRYYHSLGESREYYVPNEGKDPEAANPRYHLRGNGVRVWTPDLGRDGFQRSGYSSTNVLGLEAGGIMPAKRGEPAEIVFKVEGANVITALKISAKLFRETEADVAQISVSTVNGLAWQEVWRAKEIGEQKADLQLIAEVSGAYEVLVKVSLAAAHTASAARLQALEFETTTMLNSKTQPLLNIGKNVVYVGAGAQEESIVLWPDLQGGHYKTYVTEEKNIVTAAKHPGYMGVMHAAKGGEPAYVVFKIDAPRDLTRVSYGGRFYNRAKGSRIDLFHSFDGGKNWQRSWSLTNTTQPWDVIHYETVDHIGPGVRSVLFKYLLDSPIPGSDACSIYAVRMEANHKPAEGRFEPLPVTFDWSERQADYSVVERSHTEQITTLPHRYTINVGGADHPRMNWLRIGAAKTPDRAKLGYSDDKDVGGEKFVGNWAVYGTNFALGRPYTASAPSSTQWGAGDPEGTRLTDGVVGPPYPGGVAPASALCWNKGQHPEVTVDLGATRPCGAFRIQTGAGWPWWDALKGQIKDQVEVLTSSDGRDYTSRGFFDFQLRWKDLAANEMWPDDEVIAGHNFEVVLPQPVDARYVRYKITPERALIVSEVQALDYIRHTPFDLRIALPR